MTAIKPCPFCGYDKVQFTVSQGTKWGQVGCGRCGAAGPEVRTDYDLKDNAEWHAKALDEWNTRI